MARDVGYHKWTVEAALDVWRYLLPDRKPTNDVNEVARIISEHEWDDSWGSMDKGLVSTPPKNPYRASQDVPHA